MSRLAGEGRDCIASAVIDRLEGIAWPAVEVAALEVAIVTDAIDAPVRGSFGAMSERVSLLVRVRDTSGAAGCGEVWCNFPEGGAEYKARLTSRYAAPLLAGRVFHRPWEAWDVVDGALARLALQTGDAGAFAQVCAGVDQAMWDLFCHRVEAPLWKLAGGAPRVGVYASGIGPECVAETIRAEADAGHTRFKVKLGFGEAVDGRILDAALRTLPANAALYTDANQGWSLAEASAWLARLEDTGVGWCEEPVRADTSLADWATLTRPRARLKIAAGENLRGVAALHALARDAGLRVIQPDLGKWGGVTGALRLHARLAGDVWLCPHWLAGAVGLAASLQLVGAIRGQGPVEMDANANALRTALVDSRLVVEGGSVVLADRPGLVPPLLKDRALWQ